MSKDPARYAKEKPPHPRLAEEDYYYCENGFIVFTEAYHLKRGYCCKSLCRNCPYEKEKKDNRNLR